MMRPPDLSDPGAPSPMPGGVGPAAGAQRARVVSPWRRLPARPRENDRVLARMLGLCLIAGLLFWVVVTVALLR